MTATADHYRVFLRQYESWVLGALKPARTQLQCIFDDWKKAENWRTSGTDGKHPAPTPIIRSFSRIKRPESVSDKISRKPESFPDGLCLESIQSMSDCLGGRIITYFLSGFPMVDHAIRNHPMLELCDDDPPIAYLDERLLRNLGLSNLKSAQKESGYSSIHYIVRIKPEFWDGSASPAFELQLRTLAADIWGEIEHVLAYKPDKRTSFAVRKQFRIIASQLTAIDEHFDFLYEEQKRYREEKDIGDTDTLNAENLPAMLDRFGLSCAQREMDGILKLLASAGIENVKGLTEAATEGKIDIIRNTYRSHLKRDPIDFEVVACIAATSQIKDAVSVEPMVRMQIDFWETWESLKKSSKLSGN